MLESGLLLYTLIIRIVVPGSKTILSLSTSFAFLTSPISEYEVTLNTLIYFSSNLFILTLILSDDAFA